MAIGTPGQRYASVPSAQTTTSVISPTGTISAGSRVFVFTAAGANKGVSSVTDSVGNTYTVHSSGGDGARTVSVSSAQVTTPITTSDTITITWSVSTSSNTPIWVMEVTGLATSSAYDTGVIGSGTGTSLNSGNTSTLAQASNLVWGVARNQNAGTWTKDATYTSPSTASLATGLAALEYKTVAATTAVNATGTNTVSGGWAMGCFVFKEATVGGDATVTVPSPATGRGRADVPDPLLAVEAVVASAVGISSGPTAGITIMVGDGVQAPVATARGSAPAPTLPVAVDATVTAEPAVAAGHVTNPTVTAGTGVTVTTPAATGVAIAGTGFGSEWGGGWGSGTAVHVVITVPGVDATVTVPSPAAALGDAPAPEPVVAVGAVVALADARNDIADAVSVEVGPLAATAAADAPAPTVSTVTVVNATVTAVIADAIGRADIPVPAISVTAGALALGDAPVPAVRVDDTVTAVVATALADGPVPVPAIAVTIVVADALADAPVPVLGLVQSATVTITVGARALADAPPPTVVITCELDGTPLALTTETLSVLTLTSETLTGVTLTTETLSDIALTSTSLFPSATTYPSSTTYPLSDTPVLEPLTLEPA